MAQSLSPSNQPSSRPAGAPPAGLAATSSRWPDRVYRFLTFTAALSIFVIIAAIAVDLTFASGQSIHRFGWSFVTGSQWDETRDIYHVLPFIFGTVYSSFIALLIAVPISLGSAIFLSELCPSWIRMPLTFLIELLAAIPSVVYGLWGIFVMIPWLRDFVMKPMARVGDRLAIHAFGHTLKIPLFVGTPIGASMLAAGVILAIMVTPFITAVARDILKAIPRSQREGSLALGATQWETVSQVVLPYARSGIVGAVILGLGRALGETMAVTMVIGNSSSGNGISWSLLNPGYTMASVLANKFNEAQSDLNVSALIEIGLVLFGVAIVVNSFARLLVHYTARDVQGSK
ncbi:MAG: phosphate ABC transporter permease subunit PstC [Capsulimonadaceae bacterium]